jgi:hypothetical protein
LERDDEGGGVPEDTGEYRTRMFAGQKEILDHLEKRQGLERRVKRLEDDYDVLNQVLFGKPDAAMLRDGKRGGLVDVLRDCTDEMKKGANTRRLIVALIALNVVRFASDIPAGFWKFLPKIFAP